MSLPEWYRADPMAVELHRCQVPMHKIDEMVERAAILEMGCGMSRQEAEATVSGGEVFSRAMFTNQVSACSR